MFTILKTEYFKLCGFYKSDCTTELVNYQNLTLQTLKNDNILHIIDKMGTVVNQTSPSLLGG